MKIDTEDDRFDKDSIGTASNSTLMEEDDHDCSSVLSSSSRTEDKEGWGDSLDQKEERGEETHTKNQGRNSDKEDAAAFVAGDHVYFWCSYLGVPFAYQHHGIVVDVSTEEDSVRIWDFDLMELNHNNNNDDGNEGNNDEHNGHDKNDARCEEKHPIITTKDDDDIKNNDNDTISTESDDDETTIITKDDGNGTNNNNNSTTIENDQSTTKNHNKKKERERKQKDSSSSGLSSGGINRRRAFFSSSLSGGISSGGFARGSVAAKSGGGVDGEGYIKFTDYTMSEARKNWKKVEYRVNGVKVLKRSGTYSSMEPDNSSLVISRIHFLMDNAYLIPQFHLAKSNCECIAVWCKTGRFCSLQGLSLLNTCGAIAVGSTSIMGTAAVVVEVTVPAAGLFGWLGVTTTVSAATAMPFIIPAIAAYGAGSMAISAGAIYKNKSAWKDTNDALDDAFTTCNLAGRYLPNSPLYPLY